MSSARSPHGISPKRGPAPISASHSSSARRPRPRPRSRGRRCSRCATPSPELRRAVVSVKRKKPSSAIESAPLASAASRSREVGPWSASAASARERSSISTVEAARRLLQPGDRGLGGVEQVAIAVEPEHGSVLAHLAEAVAPRACRAPGPASSRRRRWVTTRSSSATASRPRPRTCRAARRRSSRSRCGSRRTPAARSRHTTKPPGTPTSAARRGWCTGVRCADETECRWPCWSGEFARAAWRCATRW